MDKYRKMRCKVCIKEIVFGYVDPNKDYTLCKNCAFKDDGHYGSEVKDGQEIHNKTNREPGSSY